MDGRSETRSCVLHKSIMGSVHGEGVGLVRAVVMGMVLNGGY